MGMLCRIQLLVPVRHAVPEAPTLLCCSLHYQTLLIVSPICLPIAVRTPWEYIFIGMCWKIVIGAAQGRRGWQLFGPGIPTSGLYGPGPRAVHSARNRRNDALPTVPLRMLTTV